MRPLKWAHAHYYRESNQNRPRRSRTRPGRWPSRSAWTRNATTGPGPATPMRWWRGSSPGAPGLTCSTSAAAPASRPASSRPPAARCSASSPMRGWPSSPAPAACGRGGDLRSLGAGRPDVRRGHRRPVVALGGSGRRRCEGGTGTAARGAAGDLRARVRAACRGGRAVRRRLPAGGARLAVQRPAGARRPLDALPGGVREARRQDPRDRTVRRTRTVAIRLGAVLHARPVAGPAAHHRRPHPAPPRTSWPRCWTRSGPPSTPWADASRCTTPPWPRPPYAPAPPDSIRHIAADLEIRPAVRRSAGRRRSTAGSVGGQFGRRPGGLPVTTGIPTGPGASSARGAQAGRMCRQGHFR